MTDFNQKTHDTDVGSHGGQSRQMMEVFENQEFGSIRLLQEAGKTFFCASDVAKALGYVNPYAAVKRHCRGPLTKREGVVQKVNQYGDAGEQVVEISFINGGGNAVLGTSYTAEDEDLKGVETDYTKLEDKLRKQIDRIETDHPGYDEYRYNLAEIGHNPYELASLLTVEFENYTRSQLQARLQSIFEAQYELKLEEKVEIRTRKETRVGYRYNPITGTGHTYTYQVTVQYEYKILNVTLLNRGVDYVARNSGLTDDQLQRYEVTLECRGNRDDLFAGIAFATPDGAGSSGEYQDYDIPGEALTDEKFRKMITEAEKYLGYPYVWGGSSPSTSFDCSGFVSWVINHCGNGWNVGRQTANGLMGKCDIIPKSEAKPGDLIFFQKTYNTSGASHVGIYVGNGMMIHCGSPISYASIETSYWRQHYYCMGRIR